MSGNKGTPLTTEERERRCETCDRPECSRDAAANRRDEAAHDLKRARALNATIRGVEVEAADAEAVYAAARDEHEAALRDCEAHEVDWRRRALDAAADRDRLARDLAAARARLAAAEAVCELAAEHRFSQLDAALAAWRATR